jgi:hypothetical protein
VGNVLQKLTEMSLYGYSATGNPLTAFVNMFQSAEERRDKYAFCLEADVGTAWARQMRDWRWKSIYDFMDQLEQRKQQ